MLHLQKKNQRWVVYSKQSVSPVFSALSLLTPQRSGEICLPPHLISTISIQALNAQIKTQHKNRWLDIYLITGLTKHNTGRSAPDVKRCQ